MKPCIPVLVFAQTTKSQKRKEAAVGDLEGDALDDDEDDANEQGESGINTDVHVFAHF